MFDFFYAIPRLDAIVKKIRQKFRKCFCFFRFRGGIREISDSALANNAQSFAGINFVFAGLSLP